MAITLSPASSLPPNPVPPEEEGGAWTMRAWTPLIGAWVPYRQAIAAFHASDSALHVGDKGEADKERWAEVAAHIEDALASLVRDEPEPGLGYVVMVYGHACRRMWAGLLNENQSCQEDATRGTGRRSCRRVATRHTESVPERSCKSVIRQADQSLASGRDQPERTDMANKESPTVEPVEDKLVDEVVERLVDRADASGAPLGEGRPLTARSPKPCRSEP
ncbi:RNaseH domain-containing protein [Streptomyces sp. NPDC093707]|uniref:RNaseH domain-containing protein n=1 Tax=Streptomyces sp. NPDC093707 TaxID=3154984 RepID=UPI00344EE7D2